MERLIPSFQTKVDHTLLIRRLGIAANDTNIDSGCYQLDFFTDYEALEKERNIQLAMLEVRKRFGLNAIVKGMNLQKGATTIERNMQIGGHKAGSTVLTPPQKIKKKGI